MQQYFAKNKKDNTFILNDEDYNHIKNVMRMKEHEKIIVVYNDKSYICSLNKDYLSANIEEVFKENNNKNDLTIYVPLLQEDKLSYIFKHGTELGVTKFIVVQYEHCKYKLPKKDFEKKLIRWNKIIKEASEQSYRINKPLLNDIIEVKNIESNANVNILCSLDKTDVKNICKVLTKDTSKGTINLVFGPEGGLSKNEEDIISSKGFIKTSLGEGILRTETVPLMIASIVKYLRESE